ncbi:Hypothetical protein, putative [Bodo saltans]|uniref:Leucine-rich repeat protein n=1 Tax=Bodo saltans TaxID=75058 RepID=A0A0S4KIJ3_BODSA|nr:Hypothetical protein, putative [Bodo saltans]|eukprot:CUI15517.1 Hypothetical protein, putative [Bodo saltans]
MEMTPAVLRDACKKNGGYAQPLLNDQLFLQCQGFGKIANLEPYVNLKVLWLEQNGLATIEGLEKNTILVSLFLQNNAISRISGLSALGNLRILNLSHNYISKIEGLGASCPLLETLQISHNMIPSLEACEDLWLLADTLSSVDLSYNKMERSESDAPVPTGTPDLTIVNFFKKLPNVSVIYLQGNGLSHGMKNYRKNMIVHLPQLTYLDERPVFADERRATEAWGTGGDQAEKDERALIRQEKKDELTSCVQTMAKAMEANRETRDRLTKQWDEQREREREELKVRRQENKRQINLLDAEEYDVRGVVEIEEDDAWEDIRYDLEKKFDAAMKLENTFKKIHQQEADVEALRRKVDEELKDQEERIALLLEQTAAQDAARIAKAAPKVQHVDPQSDDTLAVAAAPAGPSRLQESMNYWIRQLDKSDDDVLAQMESDLQGYLKELEPGLPTVRAVNVITDAAVTTTVKAKQPLQKMQRAVTQAVAVTSASLREGGSKNSSREALWESFYAWETRNRK